MISIARAVARNLLFVILLAPILFHMFAPTLGKQLALLLCALSFAYLQFRCFPQLMELSPTAAFSVRVVHMIGGIMLVAPLALFLIVETRKAIAISPLSAMFPLLPLACIFAQVLPGIWTRIKHW